MAWPDAGPAREFGWAVERLIESDFAGGDDLTAVHTSLISWRDNHRELEDSLRTSPALEEIEPMSIALAEVSTIGLEALDFGTSGTSATREWLDVRLDALRMAGESHGQTELVVIVPVVDLVCAVSQPESLTVEGCQEKEEAAAPQH